MTKRLRVFAGPNGSGKSSIIASIRNTEVRKGVKLDFGIYVNADEIAKNLQKDGCSIKQYGITVDKTELYEIVSNSGLINQDFGLKRFKQCFAIENGKFIVNE